MFKDMTLLGWRGRPDSNRPNRNQKTSRKPLAAARAILSIEHLNFNRRSILIPFLANKRSPTELTTGALPTAYKTRQLAPPAIAARMGHLMNGASMIHQRVATPPTLLVLPVGLNCAVQLLARWHCSIMPTRQAPPQFRASPMMSRTTASRSARSPPAASSSARLSAATLLQVEQLLLAVALLIAPAGTTLRYTPPLGPPLRLSHHPSK